MLKKVQSTTLVSGILVAAFVFGLATTASSQMVLTSNSEPLHGTAVLRSLPGIVGFNTSLEQRCTMLKHLIARANGDAGAQRYEKAEAQLLQTQVLQNGTKVFLLRKATVVCSDLPAAGPFTDAHALVLVKVNDARSKFNEEQVWVVADAIDLSTGSVDAHTQAQASASCTPNREATVLRAAKAAFPESARDLGLGPGTVQIEVTVGPSGNLISASIYKSATNMALDQAALRAARQSTYLPKVVDCKAVTGDYLFSADLIPDRD